MAPMLVINQRDGEANVVGVYFNDSVDSGPSATIPHNVVMFRCSAGKCDEVDGWVSERGEGFLDGFLSVSYYKYDIEYMDAHRLTAAASGIGRTLFVNFDTYEARVELRNHWPSYEWRIVDGEYALTHDPRLAYLCRKVYTPPRALTGSRPSCTQK